MFEATRKVHNETISDEQLVYHIQQRRSDSLCAVNQLLQRHHQALLMRCHRYLKNWQDAEDAVQETELRMIRAIDTFKGASSFRTWLYAIADNQCHSLMAKRMRNTMGDHLRALLVFMEEAKALSQPNPQDRDELAKLIERILDAMPTQASEILRLRFYVDLSIESIAQRLGIGLSAAKMRLYRSLRQAESLLKDEDRRLCA